jgi:hypothetical protein
MAKLILSSSEEAQIIKSALTTVLNELDVESKFVYELEVKALLALMETIVVNPLEDYLEIKATDPSCCGCGICQVTLPIDRFFD